MGFSYSLVRARCMHLTTITIDQVFSVERRSGKQGRYTELGFASDGHKYYSVHLPGWPNIEADVKITAFLERQDDWESLQGWLNHASGEIVSPARAKWIFFLVAGFFLTTGVSVAWNDAAPFLLYFVFVVPCGCMLRRAIQIRSKLLSLTSNSTRPR